NRKTFSGWNFATIRFTRRSMCPWAMVLFAALVMRSLVTLARLGEGRVSAARCQVEVRCSESFALTPGTSRKTVPDTREFTDTRELHLRIFRILPRRAARTRGKALLTERGNPGRTKRQAVSPPGAAFSEGRRGNDTACLSRKKVTRAPCFGRYKEETRVARQRSEHHGCGPNEQFSPAPSPRCACPRQRRTDGRATAGVLRRPAGRNRL